MIEVSETHRKPYSTRTYSSIAARIKSIDTALNVFDKKLTTLYKSKRPTSNEIRSLKSDIEAMKYMKKRLTEQLNKKSFQ